MPLKKQYLLEGSVCKVTFILPQAIKAESVFLVGSFNSWEEHDTPLKQLKSGEWKVDVKLEAGQEYQYRFLVNGNEWHNDWEADKYVPNDYGVDNSVVVT